MSKQVMSEGDVLKFFRRLWDLSTRVDGPDGAIIRRDLGEIFDAQQALRARLAEAEGERDEARHERQIMEQEMIRVLSLREDKNRIIADLGEQWGLDRQTAARLLDYLTGRSDDISHTLANEEFHDVLSAVLNMLDDSA